MRLFWFTLFLAGCASVPMDRGPASVSDTQLSQSRVFLEKVKLGHIDERQRVGVFVESTPELKGCVLYLEGFGDSILNHSPLFEELNQAGYRVLAFDYLGQGQSDGEMAQSRIDDRTVSLDYDIGEQAKRVWQMRSHWEDPIHHHTCVDSKKMIIGWSTGGLVAYKLAQERWASAVVLIAPGIVPNLCVGEAGNSSVPRCVEKNLTLDRTITLSTLTHVPLDPAGDPHVDPITPATPMDAKAFIINLITTAYFKAQLWMISPHQRGLVFLSGPNDTYVDSVATNRVLHAKAPHFTVITYPDALHEMDNEVPEIATPLRQHTVDFLNQTVQQREEKR
jgi:alpha-beta hydrolase superfamily lysophospholipase